MALVHPLRDGRRTRQIGRNGTSNQRWIVGVTVAYLVNQGGLIVAWDGAPANVYDAAFHPLNCRRSGRDGRGDRYGLCCQSG